MVRNDTYETQHWQVDTGPHACGNVKGFIEGAGRVRMDVTEGNWLNAFLSQLNSDDVVGGELLPLQLDGTISPHLSLQRDFRALMCGGGRRAKDSQRDDEEGSEEDATPHHYHLSLAVEQHQS